MPSANMGRIGFKHLVLAMTVIVTIAGNQQVAADIGKGGKGKGKGSATAVNSEAAANTGRARTAWDLAFGGAVADKDSGPTATDHVHHEPGHAPAMVESVDYDKEGAKKTDHTVNNISLEQDASGSWWILSLTYFALMLVSQFVARLMVYAVGLGRLNEGRHVGVTASLVLKILVYASQIDLATAGASINQYAPWSWLILSLAYVALLVGCILISDMLICALGGRAPNQDGFVRFTTVLMISLADLAYKLDYTLVGVCITQAAPWSWWLVSWPFFLCFLCARLEDLGDVQEGGRGSLKKDVFVGVGTVAVLGLVSLVYICRSLLLNILILWALLAVSAFLPNIFQKELGGDGPKGAQIRGLATAAMFLAAAVFFFTRRPLFFKALAFCSLLLMVIFVSMSFLGATGQWVPNDLNNKHLSVVVLVMGGALAFATPTQSLLDTALSFGAVFALSTASASVMVWSLAQAHEVDGFRLLCRSGISLFCAFGAAFVYQSYTICGVVIVIIVNYGVQTMAIRQQNRIITGNTNQE